MVEKLRIGRKFDIRGGPPEVEKSAMVGNSTSRRGSRGQKVRTGRKFEYGRRGWLAAVVMVLLSMVLAGCGGSPAVPESSTPDGAADRGCTEPGVDGRSCRHEEGGGHRRLSGVGSECRRGARPDSPMSSCRALAAAVRFGSPDCAGSR